MTDPLDAASLAAMAEFLREYEVSEDSTTRYSVETNMDTTYSEVESSRSVNNEDSPRGRFGRVCSDKDNSKMSQRETQKRRGASSEKAAKRRHRHLRKLQNERKTLKQQEGELTAELSRLQQAQQKPKVPTGPVDTLALSAWKCIAIRQRERRVEVEEQQRWLKVSLTQHEKLIHQLSDSLRQYLQRSSMETLERYPPDSNGSFLIKTLTQELDSLYASTNEVLSGVKFKMSLSPLQFQWTRKWNEAKKVLESADATIIPFGFEQTYKALSSVLLKDSNDSGRDHDGNTVAGRYRLDYSKELSDDSATLLSHSVVRRYLEADRVVFVWRALNEGQGKFSSMYTDERAWFVLRPSAKSESTDGPSVVLESYSRIVPIGFNEAISSRESAFIQVLKKADEEDVHNMMQALKRLLLENAQCTNESLSQYLNSSTG